MSEGLDGVRAKAVVSCFHVLPRNFSEGTEENHERPKACLTKIPISRLTNTAIQEGYQPSKAAIFVTPRCPFVCSFSSRFEVCSVVSAHDEVPNVEVTSVRLSSCVLA
jgi:hypothetical protein